MRFFKTLNKVSYTQARDKTYGFTIVEILLVLVLIGVITSLSVPSIQSVVSQHSDLKAATRLVHALNQVRNQATRRNRAYRVSLSQLGSQAPQGQLIIDEGARNTCRSLVDQVDLITEVSRLAFGQTQVRVDESAPQSHVGLLGWKKNTQEEAINQEPLTLCFGSNGAIFIQEGEIFTPIYGTLSLYIQHFKGEGNWTISSPAQSVHLHFSSGAQLRIR
jgi:prepilin-type N-terminal cleavage/methylation domain-containing protein